MVGSRSGGEREIADAESIGLDGAATGKCDADMAVLSMRLAGEISHILIVRLLGDFLSAISRASF